MSTQLDESRTFSAGFIIELSGLTWELLLAAHPERARELRELWDEIKFFADLVVRDPVLYEQLIHRVETRKDRGHRGG